MILKAKWDCSADFRQALMSTEGMILAEDTQDRFWGVGVGSNLALHTKPSKFLGHNMLGRILNELRDEVEFHEAGNSDSMECNLTEDNQKVSLHYEVILTSTTQVESTPSTKNHPSAPLSTSDVSANDNTVSKQVHEESTDSKHTDKCTPVQPEPTDTLTSKDSPPVQPESTDTLTSKDCAPVQPESTDTMTSNNSAPVQPESTGTVTSNDSAPVTPESTNTMTSNDCAPVQLESTNTSSGDKSVVLSLLPQSTGIITTPSGNNVPTPLKRPRSKVSKTE